VAARSGRIGATGAVRGVGARHCRSRSPYFVQRPSLPEQVLRRGLGR